MNVWVIGRFLVNLVLFFDPKCRAFCSWYTLVTAGSVYLLWDHTFHAWFCVCSGAMMIAVPVFRFTTGFTLVRWLGMIQSIVFFWNCHNIVAPWEFPATTYLFHM